MQSDPIHRPAPITTPRRSVRQLGLAWLVSTLALAVCLPLHAAEDPGATTRGFIKCLELRDANERLACYDRMAVAAVELGLTLPGAASAPMSGTPAPGPAANPPETRAAAATESFGLEQQAAAEELDSVTAKVIGGFQGWTGNTVFTLDNGQVWQQTGSGRYEYSGQDRAVVIERGFLGSFSLKPEGLNRTVRVKRIK